MYLLMYWLVLQRYPLARHLEILGMQDYHEHYVESHYTLLHRESSQVTENCHNNEKHLKLNYHQNKLLVQFRAMNYLKYAWFIASLFYQSCSTVHYIWAVNVDWQKPMEKNMNLTLMSLHKNFPQSETIWQFYSALLVSNCTFLCAWRP